MSEKGKEKKPLSEKQIAARKENAKIAGRKKLEKKLAVIEEPVSVNSEQIHAVSARPDNIADVDEVPEVAVENENEDEAVVRELLEYVDNRILSHYTTKVKPRFRKLKDKVSTEVLQPVASKPIPIPKKKIVTPNTRKSEQPDKPVAQSFDPFAKFK